MTDNRKAKKHPRLIAVVIAGLVAIGVVAEVTFNVRISWYVALFAAIASYIITVETVDWWRDRDRTPFSYQAPSEEQILKQYEEVKGYADAIGDTRPGMLESATFLLDEAKSEFERAATSSDSHEEKARTILAIVAGATSALGIFGVSRDGRTVIPSPIIVDSLIFVVVAFVCLLYVLRVKRFVQPNLSTYFSGPMTSQELAVAVRLSLAPGYARMATELRHRIRHEPRALFIAYISVVTAAVLVLLNAASSNTSAAPGPSPSPGLPSRASPKPTTPPALPPPPPSADWLIHPGLKL